MPKGRVTAGSKVLVHGSQSESKAISADQALMRRVRLGISIVLERCWLLAVGHPLHSLEQPTFQACMGRPVEWPQVCLFRYQVIIFIRDIQLGEY